MSGDGSCRYRLIQADTISDSITEYAVISILPDFPDVINFLRNRMAVNDTKHTAVTAAIGSDMP